MNGVPGRARTGSAGPPPRDAGMVTAELAVALPSVALVLGLGIATIGAVTAQLRCADAAEVAARLAARGESVAVVRSAALAVAPAGATVSVESRSVDNDAATVAVTVRDEFRVPAIGRLLPTRSLHAAFFAPAEPGVVPAKPVVTPEVVP